MARKAKIITLEEFKEKCFKEILEDFGTDGSDYFLNVNDKGLSNKIMKDLEKVEFDWENHECGVGKYSEESNPNLGFKVLDNNLPVLFCYAGGDWEVPVNFIIYWNGKELRAYIPVDGNPYDKEYKTAYGSQNETKLYRERFGKLDYHSQPDLKDEADEGERDFDKMKKDIIKRIQITN